MTDTLTTSDEKSAFWSGVFAMAVCAFALIASEFLPVSLLTPLAQDLNVSEGMAGQGIAISGAFAVFTSLFISTLAGNLDRKTLLLGLTAAMGISGAVVALTPNYTAYMIGRALIGVVVGGFWSMSVATVIRLVSAHDVPRALAILNGGNALATVIAAPLGAYLGTVIGWRGAFWCLAPLSLIALAWQWKTLPSLPATAHASGMRSVINFPAASRGVFAASLNGSFGTVARNRRKRRRMYPERFKVFTLFARPSVIVGMLASSLLFMGQFGLFTYVRPFLETVTKVQDSAISLMLLVVGVAGFIGTALIGRVLQQGFYQTLVAIPLLMAATALALVAFGGWLAVVVILLALWGLTGTSAPVGWWAWIAKVFPKDTEAGGGLFVAVVQCSIALGSTVGGLLFDTRGYAATFIASAALLVLCAGLTVITARKLAA